VSGQPGLWQNHHQLQQQQEQHHHHHSHASHVLQCCQHPAADSISSCSRNHDCCRCQTDGIKQQQMPCGQLAESPWILQPSMVPWLLLACSMARHSGGCGLLTAM